MKCSNADGSATYVCVRVGHCQASLLKDRSFNYGFLISDSSADMAQLVERTLGKGEVPSSILGISTISFKKMASEISEAFFVLSFPQFFLCIPILWLQW